MFKRLRSEEAIRWATAILVVVISGLAGQFAAQGMNLVQWLGAILAVLGSVTLAVMVRVWPAPAANRNRVED
jgi:cytochrome b subunit of formate dehydrogenase